MSTHYPRYSTKASLEHLDERTLGDYSPQQWSPYRHLTAYYVHAQLAALTTVQHEFAVVQLLLAAKEALGLTDVRTVKSDINKASYCVMNSTIEAGY